MARESRLDIDRGSIGIIFKHQKRKHHNETICLVGDPGFCLFTLSCGSNDASTADRVSRPGEYAGYSEAIYADEYEITSQYVEVSDGTGLAMDLYRPKDKTTGNVVDSPLPVLWMHTPYNRRYL